MQSKQSTFVIKKKIKLIPYYLQLYTTENTTID